MPTKADDIDPYSWSRKSRNDQSLPAQSGVYALFLREGATLPVIKPLAEGLIYIGLGKSLAKRCHFRGRTEGHSPRRSLAALLWGELRLEPELGANGNYRLSRESERKLDEWMHQNLLMSFCTIQNIKEIEDFLIAKFAPPLNLNKCSQTLEHHTVKELRASMLRDARQRSS